MRFWLLSVLSLLAVVGASAQVTGLEGWSLFVDPGHSGTENEGAYGYSEAEKNLRVALALRDLLLEQTDIDTVYLSRTNDLQVVGLSQRSDLANALGVDWFHSIHSDAPSATSNSTLLLWGQLLSGIEKTPPGGHRMSDFIVDVLTRGMRTTTRGSRGDCSFYGSFIPDACSGTGGPYLSVNRNTTMPSELSEAGFHTNPTQNQRNMNAAWKRLEAQTLMWSILDFWGIPRPPARIVTGYVSDLESGRLINGATVTIDGQAYTTDTYQTLFRFYSSDPEELRNGFYYLEGVDAGARTMTVSADGYDSDSFIVVPSDTFFTFFDVHLVSNVPPRVTSTSPSAGEELVRITTPVVVAFSRRMNRQSVESSFSIQAPVPGSFSWTNGDRTLTFRPDSLPALTAVTVRIGEAAMGTYGHAFDGDGDGIAGGEFVLTFTTGSSDTQAPEVSSTYPIANQYGIDLQPIITAVMDEVLDPASISTDQITLQTISGIRVPGTVTHNVTAGTSVLTFFPSETLVPSSVYIVRIMPGLRDLVGNQRQTIAQFYFTTGPSAAERHVLEDFETDLEANWWQPPTSESTVGVVPSATLRSPETGVVNLLTQSTTSLRLDFEWDDSASEWLIREYLGQGAPKTIQFDSTYALQAYVFGDGSGTLFRFAVQDGVPESVSNNLEASPWFPVEWIGWRLISWRPGKDGLGEWLGDGVVDGRVVFDSIQLSRAAGGNATGTLIVDDLSLVGAPLVTDVTPESTLPSEFRLFQNVPNPFRTSTTIRLNLPEPGHLSVSVFDILGKEVARLAHGDGYPAGAVELTWNAGSLPSGLYLARALFEDRTLTIPMIVAR